MKRTILFAALCVAAVFMLLLGCGNPAIGTLQSITLTAAGSTGTSEVYGEGGTLQLVATGNYSSNATKDLTSYVTYAATPIGTTEEGASLPATSAASPEVISISPTGLVTAVTPFVCTFHNNGTATQAVWALTGSYQIVATFQGISSQPIYVGVASHIGESGPPDDGQCGPSPSSSS